MDPEDPGRGNVPIPFCSCAVPCCACAMVYGTRGPVGCFQSFLLTAVLELITLCIGLFVLLPFYLSYRFQEVGLLTQGICPLLGASNSLSQRVHHFAFPAAMEVKRR